MTERRTGKLGRTVRVGEVDDGKTSDFTGRKGVEAENKVVQGRPGAEDVLLQRTERIDLEPGDEREKGR